MSKVKNSRFYLLGLAVLGPVILWLAWPSLPVPFLAFIGFVPLLEIDRYTSQEVKKYKGWTFFLYAYLFFLLWNIFCTWWVWNASPGGVVAAIIANSLLMLIPFALYRFTRKYIQKVGVSRLAFVFYWLAFEYGHLNWDLSWTWLNLGNVFATSTWAIQWYEYTGALGGTLWILLINLLVHKYLVNGDLFGPKRNIGSKIKLAFWIGLPIIISLFSYEDREKLAKTEVVVVQPNVDPYGEKFRGSPNFVPYDQQVLKLIKLSEPLITENTSFVFWPETALQGYNREETIDENYLILLVRTWLKHHPGLTVVAGIESNGPYPDQDKPPAMAKWHNERGWYDHYNTGIKISQDDIQLYHKSKLVPGVERLPFPSVMGWLQTMINFESMGNYGIQDEREVFYNSDSLGVAPVICYESIYGEFVGRYARNGAKFIGIITNDGWWKDTEGHRQHMLYGKLRAIEMRREIARSANTGISCHIDINGEVHEKTDWWTIDARRFDVALNPKVTFYAARGDYPGRLAAMLGILILLSAIVQKVTGVRRI